MQLGVRSQRAGTTLIAVVTLGLATVLMPSTPASAAPRAGSANAIISVHKAGPDNDNYVYNCAYAGWASGTKDWDCDFLTGSGGLIARHEGQSNATGWNAGNPSFNHLAPKFSGSHCSEAWAAYASFPNVSALDRSCT